MRPEEVKGSQVNESEELEMMMQASQVISNDVREMTEELGTVREESPAKFMKSRATVKAWIVISDEMQERPKVDKKCSG